MLPATTARRLALAAASKSTAFTITTFSSSSPASISAAAAVTASHASRVLATAAARRGYATPLGPPPKGFRQAPVPKWDEDTESTGNKLGKYFLLTEMARGMYILLEQFFRPP